MGESAFVDVSQMVSGNVAYHSGKPGVQGGELSGMKIKFSQPFNLTFEYSQHHFFHVSSVVARIRSEWERKERDRESKGEREKERVRGGGGREEYVGM